VLARAAADAEIGIHLRPGEQHGRAGEVGGLHRGESDGLGGRGAVLLADDARRAVRPREAPTAIDRGGAEPDPLPSASQPFSASVMGEMAPVGQEAPHAVQVASQNPAAGTSTGV